MPLGLHRTWTPSDKQRNNCRISKEITVMKWHDYEKFSDFTGAIPLNVP